MSLCSQLIKLPRMARSRKFDALQSQQLISQKCRADFQQYFSDLMKVRNTDQQKHEIRNEESQEKNEDEILWLNEFKDLLWLELQAWISERSPREQDEYLLVQRKRIPEVLNRIVEYKFEPFKGSQPAATSHEVKQETEKIECSGCLNAFCGNCALNQSKALYEVSKLLKELEGVEELYPSSRAFAVDYPLYGSSVFMDRVKAMCLWYNISCLLQLKIDIIGHMLVSLGSEGLPWPTWPAWPSPVEESSMTEEPKPCSPKEVTDIISGSKPKKLLKKQKSRVQFFVENGSDQADRHFPAEDSPGESWKSEYSGSDLPESDVELKTNFLTELPSSEKGNNPLNKIPESYNSDTDSGTSVKEDEVEEADGRLLYRSYVEKALKNKGLRQMIRWIVIIHRVSMMRAKEALRKPDLYQSDNNSSSPNSLYSEEYEVLTGPSVDELQYADLQRYGAWSPEYKELNLPQYRTLYFFLCRIPLDVIRESLCIRLEQKPVDPSALSIRQLMQEFKEGMRVGVLCKHKYRKDVQAVLLSDNEGSFPHSLLEKEFGETLRLTLNAYLDYLKRWVTMGDPAFIQKNVLEMEWSFTRSVCFAIIGGEMLAGNAFCSIASSILQSPTKYLRDGITEVELHAEMCDSSSSGDRSEKNVELRILRTIQYVVQETRDQCVKAVSITRMIRRDLEVAAEFDIRIPSTELLERLTSTGLVRVVIPNSNKYAVFVPRYFRDRKDSLQCLLDLSSRSDPLKPSFLEGAEPNSKYAQYSENDAENESYMILLQTQAENGGDLDVTNLWKGESIFVSVLKNDSIFRSHLQPRVLLLVVFNSFYLADRRREFHELLGPGLELRNENKPSSFVIAEHILLLKDEINILSQTIIDAIQKVENRHQDIRLLNLDPLELAPLISRWQEVVRTCYKLGFEFHKDVIRIVSGKPDKQLALNVILLAKLWMNFAMTNCERGRGQRPKWAAQGLDFLVTVCEMDITSCLSDEEFHKLKELIGTVVCHIIGTPINSHPPVTGASLSLGNSRSLYPASPNVRKFKRYSTSYFHDSISSNGISSLCNSSGEDLTSPDGSLTRLQNSDPKTLPWKQRIQQSISVIESEQDFRMKEANLIGHICRQVKEAKWHIRLKSVNFSWQRGVKIGQGRFGKVYVAVNNKTGELMAMKEIVLQPGDHRTVSNIVDELRIFEGIHHPHLVRYYGVEIHREDMIIFMEFCPEGTLKNLAASTDSGLPEELIRRFTRQLLEAVQVLHQNGIVHRDIKGDNIFLTNGGNSLKLGDFGCAAKIKQQTTMQGELQGFVGTQAFMAPEVFMYSLGEGHGRAVDIWSVGCVIVEMGTGKRPWFELESNYAIMFKVGMGEIPPTPSNLSEEGQEFLSHLLQHDPKLRSTADQLLEHNFLKVYQEDDPDFNRR